MARRAKPKYDPLNFDRGEDWVPPYQQAQEEAAKKLKEDPFSNVQGHTDTVEGPQPSRMDRANANLKQEVGNAGQILRDAGNLVSASFQSSGAEQAAADARSLPNMTADETAALRAQANEIARQASTAPEGQALVLSNQASALFAKADQADQLRNDPLAAQANLTEALGYRKLIQDKAAAATRSLDQLDPTGVVKTAAPLVGNVNGLLPIAGGIAGGAFGEAAFPAGGGIVGAEAGSALASGPMIKDIYNQNFNKAMDQGLTPDQADAYARKHAAAQGAVQVLGGGILGRIGAGGSSRAVIDNLIEHVARKTATGAATGAAFGAANVGAENATNKYIASTSDNAAVRKVANDSLPSDAVDLWNQLKPALGGGALLGGGLGGFHSTFDAVRQAGADSVRIQQIRERYKDQPKYTNAIQPDLPGITPASETPGPLPGQVETAKNGPTTEDVKRLQMLNDNIQVLQDKVKNGTAKTEDKQRLALLKGARARTVGMEKPRMVGNEVTEPGLGLDYPTQPLNPEFTGLPNAEPVPSNAEPIPAAAATAATPIGGAGRGIPLKNADKPGSTPRTGKKKGATTAPAGTTSADQFAAMRAKAQGNAQLSEGTTNTTVDDVVGRITGGRAATRSGDQKVMTKLVHDRNVEIVPDESHIPAGAEKTGAAGFYDGKRTYIVANKLDKANLMGDLLNVAAHEVHHAAGRSGAVTLRGFVGKDQTDATIAKLEAAAAKGDPIAKTAIEAAIKADEANKGSYREEVIPYAINAARAMRDRSSVGKRIMDDFTSAVRTKAKKFTKNADVNLNDVAYLSDKLLQEAALQGNRMTSDGGGNSMIISKGTGEADALRRNRTWLSADGHRKYEISDDQSRVTVPEDYIQSESLKLPDVLKHDELYKELPELKNVKVQFGDIEGGDIAGSYNRDLNTIFLDINHMGKDPTEFDGQLHRTLIHEANHAAQKLSGTTGGANVDKFMSPEGLKLGQEIADAYSNLHYVRDHFGHDTTDTVKFLRQEIKKLENAYAPHYTEAYNKYVRVLGEQEANFSMDNIPLTQAERDNWGPDNAETPEALSLAAHGKSFSQTGKLLAEVPPHLPKGLAANLEGFKAHLQDNVDAAEPNFRSIKQFFAKTFTPTQGRGDVLNELLHAAAGKQSALSLAAEQKINQVWDAIKLNVKNGLGEDEIVKDMHDTLDRIDAEPSAATRRSMVSALDRKYPGVGRALNVVRDFKKELTDLIIEQRSRDPKALTDKEMAIYQKMLDNAETYNTRAYLATLGGKTSTKYSEAVLREFHANPDSAAGRKVTDAMNFLIDKHLTIPDRETLTNLNDADLRRMYQTWMGKTPKLRGERARTKMIDELTGLPPKSEAEIKAKAYEVVKDLLGLNENATALATYFRGGKQNRTILESRKNVPEPIRNLLGEITHPVVREMVSLMRMSTLIHKTQMLTDIFENTKGTEWSDTVSKEHPMHLSSDAYGPMDGKFVSHRLYDMLTDSTIYATTIEQDLKAAMLDPKVAAGAVLGPVMSFMRGVSTLQKTTGLVLTPFASMANLAGSWSMAMMNGNINPRSYAKSMYDTASALKAGVRHRTADERLPVIQKLLMAKALDSATVGQWQSAMHRDILDQITRLNPESKTFMHDAKKIALSGLGKGKTALDAARSAYAWMDVWAKVATFYEKEKYLTDYYKAEGITKTEEEITREAGYETSKTNISYDMAIPIFRLLERNFSPVFMFATFTSECFRASAQSYAQVFRDVARARNAKTPEGANMARTAALKRLAGTLAITAGLNAMFMHVINGESDKDKAKRNLDAPWERTDVSIPIGLDTKGNEHRVGLSRFDPIGPVNETFRGVMLAKTPEEMHSAMVQGLTQFFIVSRTAAAMTHVVRDVLAHSVAPAEWDKARKKDTTLERNFPEAYQKLINGLSSGDVGENLSELLDTVMPGPARSILDPENSKITKVRPGDWQAGADVMTVLGGKTYVRDPDKSMTFRIIDYTKGMAALKKEKQEFLDKQNTLDPDAILGKLNDLKEKEHSLYNDLSSAYTGYLAYDKTPQDVQKVFSNARLTSIAKANLKTGKFRSELTDSKSLVTWYKKAEKAADTPEEKQSVKDKYRLLKRIYSQENTN